MDFDKIQESRSDDKEELHFFYNREERLKNAPQIVQDYYSGKFKPAKGFLELCLQQKEIDFCLLHLFCLSHLFGDILFYRIEIHC